MVLLGPNLTQVSPKFGPNSSEVLSRERRRIGPLMEAERIYDLSQCLVTAWLPVWTDGRRDISALIDVVANEVVP